MTGRRLDHELLAGLEERLLSQGIPVDDWTHPGLSSEEVHERTAAIGLRLPDEALAWWGWRNGANDAGWGKVLPRWRDFLSLERAIKEYKQSLRVAADSAPDHPHGDPNRLWRPEWFPLDDDPGQVVIDCGGAREAPIPIRRHSWEAMDEENEPVRAASFGDLVELWCRAIDVGAWEWDADAGKWWPHWERLGAGEGYGLA
jgi:cell wall assembly regulator SMI1